MTISVELPEDYGYVILTTVFCHWIATSVMGHRVMQGREKYKVVYPNLYATPGYHKEADAFNRIQRGHQNFIETLPIFMWMNMIGGLKHPRVAAVAGLLHCMGSFLYQLGYEDTTLDVNNARFMKGGGLKYFGGVAALIAAASFVVDLMKK
jgi:glutathione S-transferase